MTRRRRGTTRNPAQRLNLQPRDVEVLAWIGRAGVAELPHVARLFWGETAGSRVAAARRLRILADHGLVQTSVMALHRPNRVSLTPRGAEFIPLRMTEDTLLRTRIDGTSMSADHLAASAAVWANLATRLARVGSPRLVRFLTEAEIRRAIGSRRDSLIPDGIAMLQAAGGSTVNLAIEVDLATEGLPVISRKLARYAPCLVDGVPLHGLRLDATIIYTTGTARLGRMALMVARSPARMRVFLQELAALAPANVLEDLVAGAPDLRSGAPELQRVALV